MRKVAAAAAIIMTFLAVTGAAQAAPLTATPQQWRVDDRTDSAAPGPLSSVTAPTRDDAWTVGTSGTGHAMTPLILHWDGVHWQPVTIPGTAAFVPQLVTSASPNDVWVLGTQGKLSVAWIFNGTAWKKTVLPGPFGSGAFGTVSAHDAWGSAFAECVTVNPPGTTKCSSTISHWNGTRWSSRGLNGFLPDITVAGGHAWFLNLTSIQGANGDHITGLPVIDEVTGSTVKVVSTVAAARVALGASLTLAASASGQVWVLAHLASAKGPAVLLHWTGRRWTRIAVPARAGGRPLIAAGSLVYDGADGVWAGPFAHWTGTQWVNTFPGQLTGASAYSLTSIAAITGTTDLWGVGWVARTPTDKTHDTLIARYGTTP
jgi:hypothetical protein